MDINTAILVGTLKDTPTIHYKEDGIVSVASFAVQTQERKTVKNEVKTFTATHRVVAFGYMAKELEGATAGMRIAINGSITNKQIVNQKTGQISWITEIKANSVNLTGNGISKKAREDVQASEVEPLPEEHVSIDDLDLPF
jgi:single-stranded DNA-binding protein